MTARDARVTRRTKLTIFATIVLQLPYESKPSAKKSVSISRKMSARSEKEFMLSFLRRPFYDYDVSPEITRLSCDLGCQRRQKWVLSVNRRVAPQIKRMLDNERSFGKVSQFSNVSM